MNRAFYKKCPALNVIRGVAVPTNRQLRDALLELTRILSGLIPPLPQKKGTTVPILTIRSEQPHHIVEEKLRAIFTGTALSVFVEREDQIVRFVSFKGITENERMALEDIIKGLQLLFGKD